MLNNKVAILKVINFNDSYYFYVMIIKVNKLVGDIVLLHVHILSWVLAIILFFATYLNISKVQGASPYFKPLQMLLRLFMVLALISGFWELIKEFAAASQGEGGNHMLLTLKMLCGLGVLALMEVSIAKRKKHENSDKLFWMTIALIIVTIAIGIILPWGPISKMFGLG